MFMSDESSSRWAGHLQEHSGQAAQRSLSEIGVAVFFLYQLESY